jgi:hypothetical protein
VSNPFERLRALARSSAESSVWDDDLASEAASALMSLAGDPGLVVACRRMLAHHPAAATLWWVLAHVLASPDPRTAARQCREQLDADRTPDRLAAALPLQDDGQRLGVVGWTRAVDHAIAERVDLDVVAIKIEGADPTWSLRGRSTDRPIRIIEPWECPTQDVSLLVIPAIAYDDRSVVVPEGVRDLLWEVPDVPLWVIGGVGRVLPRQLLDALVRGSAACDDSARVELEPLEFERIERIVGPRGAEIPADAVVGFSCPLPGEMLRPF